MPPLEDILNFVSQAFTRALLQNSVYGSQPGIEFINESMTPHCNVPTIGSQVPLALITVFTQT